MSKTKKIIFWLAGIIIVLVLAVISSTIYYIYTKTWVEPPEIFGEEGVILLTEKTEYESGEEVKVTIKNNTCDDYNYPQSDEVRNNCICPEGKIKGQCMGGAYCTTNSQIPCDSVDDCPQGEFCTSDDGKIWRCTGLSCGCYYNDPKNPYLMICVD